MKNKYKVLSLLTSIPVITTIPYVTSCFESKHIIGKTHLVSYDGYYDERLDHQAFERYIGIGAGGAQYKSNLSEPVVWKLVDRNNQPITDKYINLITSGSIDEDGYYAGIDSKTTLLSWFNQKDLGTKHLKLLMKGTESKNVYSLDIDLEIVHTADDVYWSNSEYIDKLSTITEDIFQDIDYESKYLQNDNIAFNEPATWMKWVNNDTLLSNLNIPGTYHSASQYALPSVGQWKWQVTSWNWCSGWESEQDYSVIEQLNKGVRLLHFNSDLNFTNEADRTDPMNAVIANDIAPCYIDENLTQLYTMNHVFNELINWLSNKPTEVLLIQLQGSTTKDNILSWANSIGKSDYFYSTDIDTNTKLSDIRNQDNHGHIAFTKDVGGDTSDGKWVFNPDGTNLSTQQKYDIKSAEIETSLYRYSWMVPNKINTLLNKLNPSSDLYDTYHADGGIKNVIYWNRLHSNCWDPRYMRSNPKLDSELVNKILLNQDWNNSYIGKKLGWMYFHTTKGMLEDNDNLAKKIYLTNNFIN